MSKERMTKNQVAAAKRILAEVRQRIVETAGDDQRFAFALRRYLFKNLSYDERGNPTQRTKLKLQKIVEQGGKCAYPNCPVPDGRISKEDEPELDRLDAIKGYTKENTVLMHHGCHRLSQKEKGFS